MSGQPPIPTIESNIRRLGKIYRGLTLAGAIGCAAVAIQGLRGVPLGGAYTAVIAFCTGLLLLGGFMWWSRGRVASDPVVQLLRRRPDTIVKVLPKTTETQAAGATLASYQWVVLQTSSGDLHEIYVAGNAQQVVSEVRACAPDAEVDPKLCA